MRSAYGLKIPEPDPVLTRVGPDTPCGELMRRYWQPVCLSADLKDLPKPVHILGEDLVAFRDGEGKAGLLFFRCSHRGTSLEYGRVEARGLRCCYHGWLYDIEGNVLEMPLEPAGNPFLKQIQHPCYPVREFGGLVFAYMGPLEKMPEFPVYDVWQKERGQLQARMGPRVGGPVNCNWLQAEENLMDALHTFWLHTLHSGPQFPSQVYGVDPDALQYEETDIGMRFVLTRKLGNGKRWELIWEMIMPLNVHLVYTDEPKTERVRAVTYCVPIDDTHQLGASIRWIPEGESESPSGREQLAPAGRKNTSYEYAQRHPDDKEAVEGQGPIALHRLEHLVTSDKGVMMYRSILRRAIETALRGDDPKGIIRDPSQASFVTTSAGSVVKD
ncbi:MAG TPA: Rieske 2Fe-2S domain-containing protein [Verrucomicrobiae bacterium]|nr:Rieske 2Fe-2S domain-containing protein [Verrucomicrobiae bacterium]